MASRLLDELIANRFAKLQGLEIRGTVPVREELANQMLAELVQDWASAPGQSAPGQKEPRPERSTPPMSQLLSLVRKLQVRAEQGVVHLDFEIGA